MAELREILGVGPQVFPDEKQISTTKQRLTKGDDKYHRLSFLASGDKIPAVRWQLALYTNY